MFYHLAIKADERWISENRFEGLTIYNTWRKWGTKNLQVCFRPLSDVYLTCEHTFRWCGMEWVGCRRRRCSKVHGRWLFEYFTWWWWWSCARRGGDPEVMRLGDADQQNHLSVLLLPRRAPPEPKRVCVCVESRQHTRPQSEWAAANFLMQTTR